MGTKVFSTWFQQHLTQKVLNNVELMCFHSLFPEALVSVLGDRGVLTFNQYSMLGTLQQPIDEE